MDALPMLNILGEKVALGPLRPELLALYLRWRNDFALIGNLIDVGPVTLEQEEQRMAESETDPESVRFLIYDRATLQPIGITALNGIDYRNRVADFSIVIGERAFHRRGYGTEATQLMLHYAFDALGLNAIFLELFEYNPGAHRAYAKAGFRDAGRRRQAHFADGRLWDILYMDCLAEEFVRPAFIQPFIAERKH
ncbi:MAG: N-acetyltransferase [Chloroflexi bacterium]|nr:MAG: N-acetyltransferase [Chloroflexota bacterium]